LIETSVTSFTEKRLLVTLEITLVRAILLCNATVWFEPRLLVTDFASIAERNQFYLEYDEKHQAMERFERE